LKREGEIMKKITVMLIIMTVNILSAATIYVKHDAVGMNNGTSWTNAYTSFQSGLNAAASGDEIWVAKGTYKPEYSYGLGTNARRRHFRMKNEVKIYGGFAGTETLVSERVNFSSGGVNETVLSGDIGIIGTNTDNCNHIFYHPTGVALNSTALLDGFTIALGYADSNNPHNLGGGMYNYGSSPSLSNITFRNNYALGEGGGIYNYSSAPVLTNVTITDNSSSSSGGGMYNVSASSPVLTNVVIKNNTASNSGGGIYVSTASVPVITNALFLDNSASSGGGIFNTASVAFTNATFYNNSAGTGGAFYNGNASPSLNNCIIWGNTASSNGKQIYINSGSVSLNHSSYSDDSGDIYSINGGTFVPDSNSFVSNPRFLDASGGDFRIYGNSPCVNTGKNSYNTTLTDIRGEARIQNTKIDIGAYEWTDGVDSLCLMITFFVNHAATGQNDGTSWTDAFTSFQTAMDEAMSYDRIWVAKGTYKPTYDHGLGLGDRGKHFRMKEKVEIYGGFAGTETLVSERTNFSISDVNETVLSGDLDGYSGFDYQDCYHVFYHPSGLNLTSSAVLDGFTIFSGDAFGGNPNPHGGGMYNDGSSPTLRNICFYWNRAEDGAGIYNKNYSSPILENVIFASNYSTRGGGMFNDNYSSPSLNDVRFEYNYSSVSGGGMCNINNSSPILADVVFDGNISDTNGAGMFNDNFSNPTLDNTIFISNGTNIEGGGMYNYKNCSPSLTDVTFESNSAHEGGGLKNGELCSPSLTNVTFKNNSADIGGGLVNWLSSSPIMNNVTFLNNVARHYIESEALGGAVYNGQFCCPSMTNVTFDGNTAYDGSGIYNASGNDFTLTDSEFINNTSTADQGSVMYNNMSSPTLSRVKFCDNNAGAIHNLFSSPVIINSLISNNSTQYGGGIYISIYSAPRLYNVTIIRNQAQYGGGIFSASIHPIELYNCIIWGNSATGSGNQIYGSSVPVSSCYENGTNDIAGAVYSENSITTDPLFVNASGSDYRLFGISPCVNTGGNIYNTENYDLRGQARIQNTTIDMGCYEWTNGLDPYELGVPGDLTITAGTGSTLIEWTAVSGAASYKVYRSTDPYAGFSHIGTSPTNSYTDNEVLSGNKYFYYVTAVSGK
jgi:parallel beta-helix repeat protein